MTSTKAWKGERPGTVVSGSSGFGFCLGSSEEVELDGSGFAASVEGVELNGRRKEVEGTGRRDLAISRAVVAVDFIFNQW